MIKEYWATLKQWKDPLPDFYRVREYFQRLIHEIWATFNENPPKLLLMGYLSGGFFLNSLLHTWYAARIYNGIRFGPPIPGMGVGLEPLYGYFGSFFLGIIAAIATYKFINNENYIQEYPIHKAIDRAPFLGAITLLLLSQSIAGSSWAKLVLDIMILVTTFAIFSTYVRSFTIISTMAFNLSLIAFLFSIGIQWVNFITQFKPYHVAVVYYAFSAIYITLITFYVTTKNASRHAVDRK